jgi:hypothetical protein
MTLSILITIVFGTLGLSATFFLTFKQGHFKKIRLEFSPAKIINPTNNGLIDFSSGRRPRTPVIAILKFFSYHKKDYTAFSSHIYLSLENRCKYEIEDLQLVITYPRKYFDENDKRFFNSETIGDTDSHIAYTLIDDATIQVKYKFKNIHPFSIRSIMHPVLQPIEEFTKPIDIDDDFASSINSKNFSFYKVNVGISAKNLPKPLYRDFWIINILNQSYSDFMNNEKVFIYDLTKLNPYPKNIFEIHKINSYNPGKYKKEILVVKPEYPEITYSFFPPIKSPYDRKWNFEKSKLN